MNIDQHCVNRFAGAAMYSLPASADDAAFATTVGWSPHRNHGPAPARPVIAHTCNASSPASACRAFQRRSLFRAAAAPAHSLILRGKHNAACLSRRLSGVFRLRHFYEQRIHQYILRRSHPLSGRYGRPLLSPSEVPQRAVSAATSIRLSGFLAFTTALGSGIVHVYPDRDVPPLRCGFACSPHCFFRGRAIVFFLHHFHSANLIMVWISSSCAQKLYFTNCRHRWCDHRRHHPLFLARTPRVKRFTPLPGLSS